MQTFDAIVAGAGIWGCTVARRLAEAGKRVLVLEKRAAVGGNCRCEIDPETGIEVHTYGSHIFHTSNEEVWKFVRRFTEFNDYRHVVLARTKKVGGESRWTEVGKCLNVGMGECLNERGGESGALIERALPRSNIHSSTSTSYFDSRPHLDLDLQPRPHYHTYHLPIGKTLLEEFFGVSMKERNLKEFLSTVQPSTSNLQPETPRAYGDAVFDAFIRGYTSKQWGVAPEKVDPSIIARLKVRDNYSTDYFDDPHQGIPADGYNKMFERMLDHPNITVRTRSSLRFEEESRSLESKSKNGGFYIYDELSGEKIPLFDFQLQLNQQQTQPTALRLRLPTSTNSPSNSNSSLQLYYSGPIDALFNYKFGALPWRTLRFERETLSVADYQGNSVVNYTDADVPYTRIHEFKHYHPEWGNTKKVGGESRWTADCKTIIMREYSAQRKSGDEPYYPINSPESAALLAKYQAEVERINSWSLESKSKVEVEERMDQTSILQLQLGTSTPPVHSSTSNVNLILGGRLGQYKYYDMDKSIAAALALKI